MSHVFISYVRENCEVVDRLASDLGRFGVEVWLDRESISPGARWQDAIKNAIRNGSYFLACFSVEYQNRERTYMNEELTVAIDELRARPENRIWFIPVIIDDSKIPSRRISNVESLNDLQALRLAEDWDGSLKKLLNVIKHDDPLFVRSVTLEKLAQSAFDNERLHAVNELVSLNNPSLLPIIANASLDQNAVIRKSAIEGIGKHGVAAAVAVPVLIVALKDRDADIRRASADALGKVGPAAADAVIPLAAALQDQQTNVRIAAARALGNIGVAASDAVAELANALDCGNPYVQDAVAQALGNIGPVAACAVPALLKAFTDHDWSVCRQICTEAAKTIAKLGPAAVDAVPALVLALTDRHPDVPGRAAMALGAIGPAATSAVPALIDALENQNSGLDSEHTLAMHNARAGAVRALGQIGSVDAVPALIKALSDKGPQMRALAAKSLGKIGPGAAEAVSSLVDALDDPDTLTRVYAAFALGKIGPKAHAAALRLATALSDTEEDVRRIAATALQQIRG